MNEEIRRDFIELKKPFTKGGRQAFPNLRVGDPSQVQADKRDSLDVGVESVTSTREIILVIKVNC